MITEEMAKAMEWLVSQVENKVPTIEEVKKEFIESCPRENSDMSDAIEYWKRSLKGKEEK